MHPTVAEGDTHGTLLNNIIYLERHVRNCMNESGELRETLTGRADGNPQPSLSNGIKVDRKVQRLENEEPIR